ncbi:hypothetical protein [Secundilactobacillus kimchicus]|uniref:Uncharacterized protein n=1 Tax=Secundilactobacillus kimchicus JCM 15530 TaxID=1302272 RepID=A0A0R1HNQ5_9LACO|nr:hypothetical protein [Secundilactobacillus kimchicus]KRK48134.1 hypothetical protein FC96_GL001866 [Secundilactobacillus kimchicus JCM 15530]
MSEPLTVQLPQEASDQLKLQMVALLKEAVISVQGKAKESGEWLRGKSAVARYLGCSSETVSKMVLNGLNPHMIPEAPNIYFFNRREVDEYILNA